MCIADGRSTLVVKSFSPRAMERLKGIVWTPDSFEPHQPETMAWLERWLATGERTLVYVGRDFSPTAEYWSQSADQFLNTESDFANVLSARERRGQELTELDRKRSAVRSQVATPWFMFDHTEGQEEQVDALKGPWSKEIDPAKARLFLRSYPVGYDDSVLKKIGPLLDWEPPGSSAIPANAFRTGNIPKTIVNPAGNPDYESQWQPSDVVMRDTFKALSNSEVPSMENLLATMDDRPLVAELKKSSWGNSRVILLSNSSMVSNISLTNLENLIIAKNVLQTLPKQGIGFLAGNMDPTVNSGDGSEQQKGFEMLTVWPLNVISIHALFLGILVLLAVFPIFGRSKKLPVTSTREFGQHIQAVGGLLFKSRDKFYALATIADYFRNVRKEPTSVWANVDSTVTQDPQSPFKQV